MNEDLLKACLLEFSVAGLVVDRQLIRIASEEDLSTGGKVLSLLLDGQNFLEQSGRFAYLEVDPNYKVLALAVFERLKDSRITDLTYKFSSPPC